MSNQWFRSWHGAPTDPKWLGIARKADVAPGIVAAIVWALLDRASQSGDRGSITGYDADGLGCFFGCDADRVEAIIAAMHEKGILDGNKFSGWSKHQPAREDGSAERSKNWRERKQTHKNASEPEQTHKNASEPEQTLDTDTDTDTEREKDARAQGDPEAKADPPHWQPIQAILETRSGDIDEWELDFLHSIKWKPSLTKPQADSLKAIQGKLASAGASVVVPKQVAVIEGTAAWAAWTKHRGKRPPTTDIRIPGKQIQRGWYFPSEYPPTAENEAAA